MNAFQTVASHVARAFLVTTLAGASAFAHGGGTSNARATELALHRIERLVSLRRIDPVFRSGLASLKLARLVRATETEPLYRVIAQVPPPASGPAAEVEVLLDATGRTLQAFATEGGFTAPANPLPGTDPLSLTEAALHFVLDHSETRPELEPFEADLSQVTITPGAAGVEVVISTARATAILKIRVSLAGQVESAEVIDVPQPVPAEPRG